jgi:hypothetical protein
MRINNAAVVLGLLAFIVLLPESSFLQRQEMGGSFLVSSEAFGHDVSFGNQLHFGSQLGI